MHESGVNDCAWVCMRERASVKVRTGKASVQLDFGVQRGL